MFAILILTNTLVISGLFYVLGRGMEPWTLKHGHTDNECLESKDKYKPIEYPKPDGQLTFDLLSSFEPIIKFDVENAASLSLSTQGKR